ncbi:MAG: 5-oxoprolinase subunit PxpB [Terriglobales bacterium]|jgi:KipI family sensor histidine kinase inhibitor
MKVISASDSSLLVVFGNEISPAVYGEVIALFHSLRAEADPAIRNLHPAYGSLLIDFDPLQLTHEALGTTIRRIVDSRFEARRTESRLIRIPVCYDATYAPDLDRVAALAGISPEEVVRLHSSAEYRVYFLGFTPGFAYMGGLPDKLQVPRLTSPRVHVDAGSVGIAGAQTGIYPVDSPGGWQLIGRTPWRIFDPEEMPPAKLQPGDQVKFVAIGKEKFERSEPAAHLG